MFEVGWTEMLVIAIVMIVVVGPKDLPNMLRTFGRTTAKLRAMASDFQRQFNDALKEAELDDVKKSVDSLRSLNPAAEIRKQLNPFEQAAADVRSGVDAVMKPKPAVDATASTEQAAEPLKNGATTMPGVSPPEPTPATPIFPAMTDESVVAPAVQAQTAAAAVPQKAPAARKKPAPAKAAAAAPAKPAKTAAPKAAAKAEPKVQSAAKKPASGAKKPAARKTAGAAK
ncbi:Sec-independent protein translocase protein TatB [Mesorhizobium sp. M0166]|uniref:Sec-independent protein translocase protein TatB n=1 Tax=unclassified Mesorhizobium TaxID=325217 RepID=UPI00333C07C7